jgi:hypothetical protein
MRRKLTEISELSDYSDMFPDEGDEPDDGFRILIPSKKSAIPKHLRGGAKA